MGPEVWNTAIAVGGTLSAGAIGSWWQSRIARRDRRDTRQDGLRKELLTAVNDLVVALNDHRRAMWVAEDKRLTGADPHVVTDARTITHATRSAVSRPLTTVQVLATALGAHAVDAADAAFAMHNSESLEVLENRRQSARDAVDALVLAAADFFTSKGMCV